MNAVIHNLNSARSTINMLKTQDMSRELGERYVVIALEQLTFAVNLLAEQVMKQDLENNEKLRTIFARRNRPGWGIESSTDLDEVLAELTHQEYPVSR